MKSPVATAVAIAFGLLVLAATLLPLPQLSGVRLLVTGWAVSLAGAAALVAILNLLRVHWQKFSTGKDFYSPVLLLAFLLTVGAGFWFTPQSSQFQRVVTSIQVPLETSQLAILTVTLALAGLRFLQRRRGLMPVVFAISAVLFLLLGSGLLPLGSGLTALLNALPLGGGRGILLGIALGSLTTGLRILMGVDRPYSG